MASIARIESIWRPEHGTKPRERLLRRLRWFDWVSRDDLWLALELESAEPGVRARYTQALTRLVQSGRVEAQRDVCPNAYRLKR